MGKIERIARVMCDYHQQDPDELEPGTCPYGDNVRIVDGRMRNGDPGFFWWRHYVPLARRVARIK